VIKLKSCYSSDRGVEDCRVLFDMAGDPNNPTNNYRVQYKIELPSNRQCNSNLQEPYPLFSIWVGCPRCEEIPQVVRCTVNERDCRGNQVEIAFVTGRFLCSTERCPDSQGHDLPRSR